MRISENLRRVEDRIDAALRRAGRSDVVRLVAVTKGRAPAEVREALAAGVREVGENRVQEARAKWAELAPDFQRAGVRRHMIGHLQRNKVAAALELFDDVQSVDSLRLARKISDHAAASDRRVRVLLQVNGGAEVTKFGFSLDEVEAALPEIAGLAGVVVEGLMAVAPLDSGESRLREIFGEVRGRFERLRSTFPELPLGQLSMGMSGDFEVAVEEGATMVRIGSAIFSGP